MNDFMAATHWNRPAGMFFLRTLLGIIFGLQGYAKVFTYGLWGVYDNAFKPFEAMMPAWWLVSVLFFTTIVEMIGGLCLVLGIFRRWALALLAVDLLVVSIGHGLESPIWDMQHVMPRAILTGALLLLPAEWDTWVLPKVFERRA